MNALILGGQSPRHYDWVRQVAKALRPHADEVAYLDYRHWQTGQPDFDIEYEIGRAAKLAGGLSDYIIVAKSIGTVISTLAVARGLIKPRACVFMGFPFKVVQREIPEVAEALESLPTVAFIQNEHDPLGSAEDVQKFIQAHAPAKYEFQTLPGGTHDYTDFELIIKLAKAL